MSTCEMSSPSYMIPFERLLVAVLTSFLVLFFFFFTLDNSLPLKSSFGFCFPCSLLQNTTQKIS